MRNVRKEAAFGLVQFNELLMIFFEKKFLRVHLAFLFVNRVTKLKFLKARQAVEIISSHREDTSDRDEVKIVEENIALGRLMKNECMSETGSQIQPQRNDQ